MKQVVDIHECLNDSPEFRKSLSDAEQYATQLETSVKTMMKLLKIQLEMTMDQSQKQQLLITELSQFAKNEQDEPVIQTAMQRFAEAISEIEKSRQMMCSNVTNAFMDPLDSLLRKDFQSLKESKKVFDKSSDNQDSTLERYLSKKPKDPAITETAEELSLIRHSMHERSIQYSMDLNSFQTKTRADVLENIMALIYAQMSFYHQAHEQLQECEPKMRELSEKLTALKKSQDDQKRKDDADREVILREAIPRYNPLIFVPEKSGPVPTTKFGYLMKRGSGQIIQVWSRRWFTLKGDYLIYETRGKDEPPTMAANLRLCTVKPFENLERRFCFELVSPSKAYVLQAENERDLKEWMDVLQHAIIRAINTDHSAEHLTKGFKKEKLDMEFMEADSLVSKIKLEAKAEFLEHVAKIRALPGNNICADCSTEKPEWTSINTGSLICIECSGIHRSLGVQFSKVRSLSLDKWDQESLDVLINLGNAKSNGIFEAKFSDQQAIKKPSPKSEQSEKTRFIVAKYQQKQFVNSIENASPKFWEAAAQNNFETALQLIAGGANIDWRQMEKDGRTALIDAIDTGRSAMVSFLLSWNAAIDIADNNGNTAIHSAVKFKNEKFITWLLKRNASLTNKNREGKTAIDFAVDDSDAELVTRLRMHLFEIEDNQVPLGAKLDTYRKSSDPDVSISAGKPNGTNVVQETSPSEKALSPPVASLKSPVSTVTPTSAGSAKSQASQPGQPSQTISSQASSMAGAASAYASKLTGLAKSGFAKLHSDYAPNKNPTSTASSASATNNEESAEKKKKFNFSFKNPLGAGNSGYAAMNGGVASAMDDDEDGDIAG